MADDVQKVWHQNLDQERRFWKHVIDGSTPQKKYTERFHRLDQRPFPKYLRKYTDATRTTRILDVGAGPHTVIGFVGAPGPIEIVAIDPLADQYNADLEANGISPLVRTRRGEAERLTDYGLGEFDIVYSRNALDHAYDPVQAIGCMVSVTKRNGLVFLEGNVNVAKKMAYHGLHQWNFEPTVEGDLIVWRGNERRSVRDCLEGKASVSASGKTWYFVEIRPIGNTS
jgi:SAM-dependent methyltransferase